MKNIHITPTDKPSRLCFRNYYFLNKDSIGTYSNVDFRNIYITDNSEIKDGDWYVYKNSIFKSDDDSLVASKHCKKIILTTDTKLIEDGVQDIDDTFLEFFVKNPSCEVVEVEKRELNTDYRSDWKQKFY